MRIRNSRSPFPPPSLPEPISRSARLLHFEDCFLVEETNRKIGWSFIPLKNPACQDTGESSCGEINKMTSRKIKPIKGQDEVLGGQPEAQDTEANEGNEPQQSTNNQKDGNASSSALSIVLALPAPNSELGKRMYKMKKQTCQTETRNKEEVAIPQKVVEPRKIPKQEDVEDKNGSKRIMTISCSLNCEFVLNEDPDNKGIDGHEMPEGMGLKDTAAEVKEKPRRGRKRNECDQSGAANWFTEMSIGKQCKPQKREEHTANENNGCMEKQKRKRGRPKRG